MRTPVIDFHCDLLAYIAKKGEMAAAFDPKSRCSLPLLKEGGVILQALTLWAEKEKHSHELFLKQYVAYETLLKESTLEIETILAIESASGLLNEEEPFHLFKPRLEKIPRPLYVSLTWKEENRFGGGDTSTVGLKEDGERALEILAEKNIPIDLSHTSDALAEDILNTIHKKGLSLTPIASHSNFRAVCPAKRNLPDAIAKEIVRQGGVIGLNFVRHFVGEDKTYFLKMLEYAIECVGEDHLVMGSDFFGGIEIPALSHKGCSYFPSLDNAACFPTFLELLSQAFSKEQIEKWAFQNAKRFLCEQGFYQQQEVDHANLTP